MLIVAPATLEERTQYKCHFVLTGGDSRREMAASGSSAPAACTACIRSRRCPRPVGQDAEAKVAESQRAEGLTAPTAAATGLDSVAQSCGLSLPTFNK